MTEVSKPVRGQQVTVSNGSLGSLAVGEPFDYQWPNGDVEHYPVCQEGTQQADGKNFHVRVGVCDRWAYGASRGRATIWVNHYPIAEFVEADDGKSWFSGLPSAILPKGLAKQGEPLPAEFSEFKCAPITSLVGGTGQTMRVVVQGDDIGAMAKFAVIKALKVGKA